MHRPSLFALALLLVGCASSSPTTTSVSSVAATAPSKSSAPLVDHYGDSIETAVTVPTDAADEAKWENSWIHDRFGDFRRVRWGMGHQDDRRYDVITIEIQETHQEQTVYFDITDFWLSMAAKNKK